MNRAQGREWWDGLDENTRRIAELVDSPLRIVAGPGTGKTFTLMRRVARLLDGGAPPERILVCTFTRTAARDLQKELAQLGVPGVERVQAGTLHAFCFGILARDDVLQLTGRVPRPLLAFEERFLLEDLSAARLGGIRECRRRLQAFNAAWARLQTEDPGWPRTSADRAFHLALEAWLRFHKGMLVGEIIPEALRYLRNNPASPDRTAFDHVLVDEYQDLNRAEQVLLDLFAESGMFTLVGDQDQSIYSFKFAHPEGVSDFDQTHPGTHDEFLRQCRRCPRRIVEMASALIRNNPDATEEPLAVLPGNPEGEVHVVQWPSLEDEAEGVARFIRQRVGSGSVQPGRVLVLAPRRQLGYAVRDALNGEGVPAHSFFHEEAFDGNPKKLNECEAQKVFTLLTLLAEPEDRVALRCWCGFGSSSLRAGAWSRLRGHCEETGESVSTALARLAGGSLRIAYTNPLIERYDILEQHMQELGGLRGSDLADALFPDDQDWAQPFRTVAATMEEDNFDASALRETLRIGITQPELPTDVDYVRVMSLHKSKGLTADLVVILACVGGMIPSIDTRLPPAEQQASLQEQRRLFYVAMTRARHTLVLSSSRSIPRDLAHKMRTIVRRGNETHALTISSRFIDELGQECPLAKRGEEIL